MFGGLAHDIWHITSLPASPAGDQDPPPCRATTPAAMIGEGNSACDIDPAPAPRPRPRRRPPRRRRRPRSTAPAAKIRRRSISRRGTRRPRRPNTGPHADPDAEPPLAAARPGCGGGVVAPTCSPRHAPEEKVSPKARSSRRWRCSASSRQPPRARSRRGKDAALPHPHPAGRPGPRRAVALRPRPRAHRLPPPVAGGAPWGKRASTR